MRAKTWIVSVMGLMCASIWPVWAGLNIQHWTTSQGARVLFVENHDLPMLDVSVDFPAGSAYDRHGKTGLAAMTRHMMQLGAGEFSEKEVAERLADVGAQLSNRGDADRAGFVLRTLSAESARPRAVHLLREILSAPHFSEEILAREKARAIANLHDAATKPEYLAARAFAKALYAAHPYALPESGEPEDLATLTHTDLQDFYRQHYRATAMSLALMGDISRVQAEQLAEYLAAGLPVGAAPGPVPEVPWQAVGSERIVPHPASQSHVLIGMPGMTRDDPDYFPLYVGNYVLGGGGFDSRLMEAVRQKKGLAYSVYSYFSPMQARGVFQIGLQTRRESTDDAVATTRAVLQGYLDAGPSDAEVTQAKNNIVGGFPMRLDSNKKILEYLAVMGFYRLPADWLDTYPARVEAVTRDDIMRAFRARLIPGALHTVIVGGQVVEQAAGLPIPGAQPHTR